MAHQKINKLEKSFNKNEKGLELLRYIQFELTNVDLNIIEKRFQLLCSDELEFLDNILRKKQKYRDLLDLRNQAVDMILGSVSTRRRDGLQKYFVWSARVEQILN